MLLTFVIVCECLCVCVWVICSIYLINLSPQIFIPLPLFINLSTTKILQNNIETLGRTFYSLYHHNLYIRILLIHLFICTTSPDTIVWSFTLEPIVIAYIVYIQSRYQIDKKKRECVAKVGTSNGNPTQGERNSKRSN